MSLNLKEVKVVEKIDYKRQLKQLYFCSNKVINIVNVPTMKFLRIDRDAIKDKDNSMMDASEAIVRLSYTIKFIIKRSKIGIDYISMPLECIWWNDGGEIFNVEDKARMEWSLCIMQPDFITESVLKEGIERTSKKKKMDCLDKVYLDSIEEGLCIQIMHIGPYDGENDTIDKLQAYLEVNGYELNGKYHEIYLGDPRRARPENLKTIIRQPIKRIEN
jgi:hypothetical protein